MNVGLHEDNIPIAGFNIWIYITATVGLAWALPHERPSELYDDLVEKLNDGSLGLLPKDTDHKDEDDTDQTSEKGEDDKTPVKIESDIERIDNNIGNNYYRKHERPQYYSNYYTNYYKGYNPYKSNYVNRFHSPLRYFKKPNYYQNYNDKKHANFYSPNYHAPMSYARNYMNNNPWAKISRRISNIVQKPRKYFSGNNRHTQRPQRIYSVYGKRKKRFADNSLSKKLEKLDFDYHKNTRFALYEKIVKFIQSKDKNGTECILKAFCETRQHENDRVPSDLLSEIFRTIFTLPAHELNNGKNNNNKNFSNKNHRIYYDAYTHNGINCKEHYPLCTGSIWTFNYVMV